MNEDSYCKVSPRFDMSDQNESKVATAEVPENAQDLTIFVQNLLEQMVIC